jgi:chromosomal replication initiation ATPase DnaA
LVSFSIWAPDSGLLRKLAQKLFQDRQLTVPESLIDRMLVALERSPQAIREFVAKADAAALAEHRPVNSALIRALLAEIDQGGRMTESGDSSKFVDEDARNSPHGEAEG